MSMSVFDLLKAAGRHPNMQISKVEKNRLTSSCPRAALRCSTVQEGARPRRKSKPKMKNKFVLMFRGNVVIVPGFIDMLQTPGRGAATQKLHTENENGGSRIGLEGFM